MISEQDKEKIRKANTANIVRKVKAGKPLTKTELALIDAAPEAEETEEAATVKAGRRRKISVHSLSVETGINERTVRKRLVDAGLFPPDKHPLAKILDVLRPSVGDKDGDSIKEKKTFEEWRKLKLANDVKEGALIPRANVAETVRQLAAKFAALLDAKLEQEYPATVAGLDVPAARIYGKKLNDQLRAEVQAWSEVWRGK